MRTTVQLDSRVYIVSPEDDLPLGGKLWSVVSASLVDEITDELVLGKARLQADRPGLAARSLQDGTVVLSGRPLHLFPRLASQSYDVELSIHLDRYVPRQVVATLDHTDPGNSGFPESFEPVSLTIMMHRSPTEFRGRVVRDNGGGITPAGGALVRVTGIWPTPRLAQVAPPPAQAPNFVSMPAPFYFDRASSTTVVRRRPLLAAGGTKQLLESVQPGSQSIRLSDQSGLLPGSILQIDLSDPERSELVVIDTVIGSSDVDLPARVELAYPVHRPHRVSVEVVRMDPQPTGSDRSLTRDTVRHDSCLFLNSIAGLSDLDTVEVSGAPHPDEYHVVRLPQGLSDGDGYYRLPPLTRIAEVALEISHGADSLSEEISIDYSRREYPIDFVIRP